MSFLSQKYYEFLQEQRKKQKTIEFQERQKKYKEIKNNETINKTGTRNINK